MKWRILFIFCCSLNCLPLARSQSVPLSAGKWVKIAVSKQGMYQVTGAQLKTWGFSLPFASNQVKLFNLNNSSISESLLVSPVNGLNENAIDVQDGGDGQFDNQDYFLFYSQGNVKWGWNKVSEQYEHLKNAGSDSIFYFVTLGNAGARIVKQKNNLIANASTDEFDDLFVFEKDTLNILNSGKLWLGNPMGFGVGKQNKISYSLNLDGIGNNALIKFRASYAASVTQSEAVFDLSLNDQKYKSTIVSPVSGFVYDDAFVRVLDIFSVPVNKALTGSNLTNSNLTVNYNSTNPNGTGWIDFVSMEAKRKLGFYGNKSLSFRNNNFIGKGKVLQYLLKDLDITTKVWEVTYPERPSEMLIANFSSSSGTGSIIQNSDTIRDFFSVKQGAFEVPVLSEILNVDYPSLLNTPNVDYVIITASDYLKSAVQLAQFHESKHGFKTFTTTSSRVYNEFSGGNPSPVGIRNFIKFLADKAKQNKVNPPQYLLLIGMGNFDLKKINNSTQIPTFQSEVSNSVLSSYTSDDFFAILKDKEDINFPTNIKELGIAVGRIPARTAAEADSAVKKLIAYQTLMNEGSWKNQLTFIADDGDYNLHLQHAEEIIGSLKSLQSDWNQKKIYLDLFPVTNSTSGNTYPMVNTAINQSVNNGALVLNYTGHGNYTRLSEEAVISQKDMQQWNNAGKLPLMITASCDFAPYDQPQLQPIGLDAFLKNSNGIIGLVAASRLVFAYINKEINKEYIQQLLVPDSVGNYKTIGTALQLAKMAQWKNGGDHLNAFKFSLIGDPALQLSTSSYKIDIESVNNKKFTGKDTLTAGGKYQLKGLIKNKGQLQTDFDGLVEFTLLDAPKKQKTLGNIASSFVTEVISQESILFKGKAEVMKGVFMIDFILPKEVTINQGSLKMQLYASNKTKDALGTFDGLQVNNFSENNSKDTTGPSFVRRYINDPLNEYKQGAWINKNSTIYIYLKDSSGIQTSGNSLGQNLTLIIDGAVQSPINLNNYYTSEVNTYQKGVIQFLLPTLSVGKHQLIFKAWDLVGNSNRDTLNVVVPDNQKLVIHHLTNYPNPVKTNTIFSFEISQTALEGEITSYNLSIFDVNGIRKIFNSYTASPNTNRVIISDVSEVASLLPGLYYYRLTLNTANFSQVALSSFIKF